MTVGTGRFDRLIRVVDALPHLTCTLQIGDGSVVPENHPYFRIKADLSEEYASHDLIVSHGGAATLFEILHMGKPVVAVPNLRRSDEHQLEIVEHLAGQGYCLYCRDPEEIETYIRQSSSFEFRPYEREGCDIEELVRRHFA